jgi:ABC-type transporter Mla MlaB component
VTANAAPPEALTFKTAPALLARADGIVAAGELDLSDVRRIDSAGVALLLELRRRAARAQKPLRLHGATAELRGLSTFFGVDSLLDLQ